MSAAGMPSGIISNTSTRNMQSKVHKKVLLGGTEDEYNKLNVVRALKENQRDHYADSESPKG